jgi:hypothetical protein
MAGGRLGSGAPARELTSDGIADESLDSADVPAAVVCKLCGRSDCMGCFGDDTTGASRVLTIVPWERPGVGFLARLFGTMQATTRNPETFFASLPDGPIVPALQFALAAEVCAVGSSAALITPLVVLGIPGLLLRCLESSAARQGVACSAFVGIVGFSGLLVGAHAIHGLVLGVRGSLTASRSRGARFGLYACGWDLGSSPAGFVAALFEGGLRAAGTLLAASVSAPGRATRAALAGIFRLEGAAAIRARRRAVAVAMVLTVPAVIVILALMALAALYA